jgi:hypothetical protein
MAELQAGGEGLMNSALAQLQVVGTQMDTPEGAASARALQAAAGGLHSLIKALEGVLPSAHYIQVRPALMWIAVRPGVGLQTRGDAVDELLLLLHTLIRCLHLFDYTN